MQTKPSYPIDSASIPGCGPNLHPEKAYLRWYNNIALHNETLFPTNSFHQWRSLPWLPADMMMMMQNTNGIESSTATAPPVTSSTSSSSVDSPFQLYKCIGIIVSRREHGKNLIFCNFEVWDTTDIESYEKRYPLPLSTDNETKGTNITVPIDNITSKPCYVMQMKVVSEDHTVKSSSSTNPSLSISDHFLQNTPLNNKVAAYVKSSKFKDTLAHHLVFTRPGAVVLGIGNVEQIPHKTHKDFNIHSLQLLQVRPDPIYIHPLLTYAHNVQFYRDRCKEYLQNYLLNDQAKDAPIQHFSLLRHHLLFNDQINQLFLHYLCQVLNCTMETIDILLQWLQIHGTEYDKHFDTETKAEEIQSSKIASRGKLSKKNVTTKMVVNTEGTEKNNKSNDLPVTIDGNYDLETQIANLDIDNENTVDLSSEDFIDDSKGNPPVKLNYQLNLVRLCRNINHKVLVRVSGMSRRIIPNEQLSLLGELEQVIASNSYLYRSDEFRINLEDDKEGKYLIPYTETSSTLNALAIKEWIDQVLQKVHPRENLPEFTTAQRNDEYNSTLSIHAVNNPSSTPQKRYHYIEDKKVPQIASFLYNLYTMFQYKPNESSFRHAVDIGGGRGDLAIAVAVAFPNLFITVIDINQSSLDAGKFRAKQLHLANIRFILGDVKDVHTILSETWSKGNFTMDDTLALPKDKYQTGYEKEYYRPDLFIGLHVCGSLSDWSIYLSGYYQASCILCPCCFGKHRRLHDSLLATIQKNQGTTATVNLSTTDTNAVSERTFIGQPLTTLRILQNLADANEAHLRPVAIRSMRIINSLRLFQCLQLGKINYYGTPSSSSAIPPASLLHGLGTFPCTYSMKNQLIIYIQGKENE